MPDNPQTPKRNFTPDWFVQGALTRIGDTLDRLTGRHWRPSSSLATSGLIERMKMLLDREIKQDAEGRNFVPHNIKLKMQWDKFSTDSEENLRKLEHELLTAAVDHISDNRYYTHAPLHLEVKPDYFTEGVKLYVSFDEFVGEKDREAEINVTVPAAKVTDLIPEGVSGGSLATPATPSTPPIQEGSLVGASPMLEGSLVVRYQLDGKEPVEKKLGLGAGKRLSIGRTRGNDIALDHTSVSKMHASLLLNTDGKLVVADTGSTNGTYLNGERIAYGKAIEIFSGDKVKFGAVEVELDYNSHATDEETATPDAATVGDVPSSRRTEVLKSAVEDGSRDANEVNRG